MPTVPFEDAELLSPAMEISAALQHSSIELAKAHQQANKDHDAIIMALAQQAVHVFAMDTKLKLIATSQAEGSLGQSYRSLCIIRDQMRSALCEVSIEIEDPSGKPYEEVADRIDVVSWRLHENFPTEVVIEVHQPIVIYHGKLIWPGRVIMGAPPKEESNITDTV
jgi:hypothetical protein